MEKYKKVIENMLNKNLKDKENFLREMLKNDCNAKKITEKEYEELKQFLEQKIKEIEEKSSIEKGLKDEILPSKQFKQQYKVAEPIHSKAKKEIKFTPIIRGQWVKSIPNGNDGPNQKGER